MRPQQNAAPLPGFPGNRKFPENHTELSVWRVSAALSAIRRPRTARAGGAEGRPRRVADAKVLPQAGRTLRELLELLLHQVPLLQQEPFLPALLRTVPQDMTGVVTGWLHKDRRRPGRDTENKGIKHSLAHNADASCI